MKVENQEIDSSNRFNHTSMNYDTATCTHAKQQAPTHSQAKVSNIVVSEKCQRVSGQERSWTWVPKVFERVPDLHRGINTAPAIHDVTLSGRRHEARGRQPSRSTSKRAPLLSVARGERRRARRERRKTWVREGKRHAWRVNAALWSGSLWQVVP